MLRSIFLCIALFRTANGGKNESFVRKGGLNSKLQPYEKCIVQLKSLEVKTSVYSQPQCSGLLDKMPENLFPFGKSRNEGGVSRCLLGSGELPAFALYHSRYANVTDRGVCSSRNVIQREGLRSTWYDKEGSTKIDYLDPAPLFKDLEAKNIKKIIFSGDSMSIQVAMFFVCDLSRIDGMSVQLQSEQSREFVVVVTYKGYTVTIEYVSFFLNRIIDSDMQQAKIPQGAHDKIFATFDNIVNRASPVGHTLLIYNQGLQIHNTPNSKEITDIVASGLLRLAKGFPEKFTVFYRETSAQHFAQNVGGDYEGDASPMPRGPYCCGAAKNGKLSLEYQKWRMNQFRQSFFEADPKWEKHITWIPFFQTTAELGDLHSETFHPWFYAHKDTIPTESHQRVMDCTHFVYVPFLFLPLWVATSRAIHQHTK